MVVLEHIKAFSTYKWFGKCLSGVHSRRLIIVRKDNCRVLAISQCFSLFLELVRMNAGLQSVTMRANYE